MVGIAKVSMEAAAGSFAATPSCAPPATVVADLLAGVAAAHGAEGAVYIHLGHALGAGSEGLVIKVRRMAATAGFDVEQYLRRQYLALDPLAAQARESYAPFAWRLGDLDTSEPGRRRWIGVMAGWGAAGGVVAPLQDYARGPAFLNLFARGGDLLGDIDPGALMRSAEAVHAAARDLPCLEAGPAGAALNEREMAVLRLAALGRTEVETAEVLALSRRGVQFHLARAIEKLDAANKTAAVALAINAGLIRF